MLRSIRTSVVTKRHKQCSANVRNTNVFHAYTLCVTKDWTGHRMITTDVHAMSLSSFMLRTKRLILFKVVTSVICVGESDRCSL